MAIPWISDRFRSPADRAGRRRRDRSQTHRQEESPPEEVAAARIRRRRYTSFGIGAFLIAVVFGIVAFGYYDEFYKPPRVWAGSVNNVEFNMGDLVSRIRVLQGVNRYQGGQVDLSTVPFEEMQNLMNAEVLRQLGPELGIAPTDADIEAGVRLQFEPRTVPGQEADPGQLEREYRENYRYFLTQTNLSDADYRIITEEQISLRRLLAAIGATIESPQEQVEVQWIRIPVDRNPQTLSVEPDDVVRRLAIDDFRTVAQEVSQSVGFARSDGYVGWVPRDAFPELDRHLYGDLELGIEAIEPGQTSKPIYTSEGIFIIQLLSGPEIQELNPLVHSKLNVELVKEWQEERRAAGSDDGTIKMQLNSRLYAWVADQVFVTAPRLSPEQRQQAQPGR